MFRPSLWKVVKTKKYGLDFGTILRFWPQRKNGPFSVLSLRTRTIWPNFIKIWVIFPSEVGTVQNGQNFALRQISLKRSLYVKIWRKQTTFFNTVLGTRQSQNVNIMSFSWHFLANISLWGIYLWNGCSTSTNLWKRSTCFFSNFKMWFLCHFWGISWPKFLIIA